MIVKRLAAKIAKEAAYVSTGYAETVVAVDCVCTIYESTAAPNVNESNCEF
jgi:hypothetical protein